MHARLAELMNFAEQARLDLVASVTGVPEERQRVRLRDGAWSIVEILGHLHLVEKSSLRAMFRAFRTARDAGLGSETESTSVLGLIDRFRLPDTESRMIAPAFTVPDTGGDIPSLLTRLAESRDGLRAWAREVDGYALGNVRFPHPALGDLSLYGWVLMIGQHEQRHTRQIREITAGTAS